MVVTVLEHVPHGALVRDRPDTAPRCFLGLDLGQADDYTALSLVERVTLPTGRFRDTGDRVPVQPPSGPLTTAPVVESETIQHLHVTALTRFDLRTSYVVMASVVKTAVGQLPHAPKPVLVLDHTGVGRAVLDIFVQARLGIPIIAVTITGGEQPHRDHDRPWEWTVPKKDLVSALQVVVQDDRFRVAPALDHAAILAEEMQNFRMKINQSATISYEHWRSGQHDDLVLSIALPVWAIGRLGMPGGLI